MGLNILDLIIIIKRKKKTKKKTKMDLNEKKQKLTRTSRGRAATGHPRREATRPYGLGAEQSGSGWTEPRLLPHGLTRTPLIGFQNRGRLFIAEEAERRFPLRSSPQARPAAPAPAAVRGSLTCSLGVAGLGGGGSPGAARRALPSRVSIPPSRPRRRLLICLWHHMGARRGRSSSRALPLTRTGLLRTSSPRDRKPGQPQATANRVPVPIPGHPGSGRRAGTCRDPPGCRGWAAWRVAPPP